jgi:TetR/AcrR family transcriptional regulator, regulator of autoinduction and epiphytic fitness
MASNNTSKKPAAKPTAKAKSGTKLVSKPPTQPGRPSFKQQMLLAREQAIIDVVNRLLAEKGFDAMTVDEVAFEVGVAKASLYKHFPSKEDLGAAAMVRVMQRGIAQMSALPAGMNELDKLKAVAIWMMQLKLKGEMPNLPSQNSTLRATLAANKAYIDALLTISDTLGAWIEAAQAQGKISRDLPAIMVLYAMYARACDPVLEFLKASELYSDEDIVQMSLDACFSGLASR